MTLKLELSDLNVNNMAKANMIYFFNVHFGKSLFFNIYQKAEKHIIIIEAKDHGEKVQLSSTCTVIVNIEDGNNHTPVLIGRTVSNYFSQSH